MGPDKEMRFNFHSGGCVCYNALNEYFGNGKHAYLSACSTTPAQRLGMCGPETSASINI